MRSRIVMTYNVRHCRGLDGIVDLDRVARVIGEVAPDLLALQELDVGLERSGRADQPAELAARTGMHVYFHPTIQRRAGRYGIALAARRPLDISAVDLPRHGSTEPRAALVAELQGALVVATHLSRSAAARRAQIEFISFLVEDREGPALVLGDLNAGRDELGPLGRAGLSGGPVVATHPARRPRSQLDHILVTPDLGLARTRAIPGDASDHLPLVAEVTL